jgi:hypothetical protein
LKNFKQCSYKREREEEEEEEEEERSLFYGAKKDWRLGSAGLH